MSTTQLHIGTTAPVIEVPKAKEAQVRFGGKAAGIQGILNDYLARFTPVNTADKVSFFRLLATMINAGISIVKALQILEQQSENPHFQKIIRDIVNKVEGGKSFSEALGTYPEYFTEAQIGMVEMGEATGRLNQTLLQIAVETEKSASITSKIKGAMIYPTVVVIIMVVAGIAVMTFVMPRIKEMFSSLGGQLPAMTQVLLNVSDFMVGTTFGLPNVALVVGGLAALVFSFLWWKKTVSGRYIWAQIALKIPVFGKLIQKVALARFCRSLSTLINSGVSIIKALRITASSVGNAVYEKRINAIADDVKQGITMGENMKDDLSHFPTMLVGMISVAEQTAQIDTISEKLAEYYEEEVNETVKDLSSLIEPIIIVVLGLSVAFLVISVMLPILQSSDLASSAS